MYEIFLNDNTLLYSSSRVELQRGIIIKGLKLELNKAGSLSFVLHSTHSSYDSLEPMKSIITVKDDGVEIFRGRVNRYTTSFYNERSVECEGDLAYLNDSLVAPNRVIGVEQSSNDGVTETVEAFFRRCITAHNSQVETWKQFTVGNITISQKSKTDTFKLNGYNTTINVIDSELLKYYGGYLRTRRVGNTSYIDYLESYNEGTSQPIQFSVNLLDLTEDTNTDDLYSILVPTGKDDLTIESVNDGSKELVNDILVGEFGRIYKSENFSDIESASELKSVAMEQMGRDILAFFPSYSCKVLDLHLMYPSLGKLLIGYSVHVVSDPQGIDITDTILSAQIDIQNPENSTYEIGKYSSELQRRSKDLSSKQASDSQSASAKSAKDEKDKQATASTITNVKYDLNRHGEEIEDHAHRISLIASDADLAEIESGTISSMYQWSKLELTSTQSELSTNAKLTTDIGTKLVSAGVFNSITPVKDEHDKIVDYTISSNLMVTKEVHDTANGQIKDSLVSAGVYTSIDAQGNPTAIVKVVGKDGVITAINTSTEGVQIQAAKVDLGAYATVNYLDANFVKSNWFSSNTLTVGGLRVTGGSTFAGVTSSGNISASSGTITGSSIVTTGGINLDNHYHSVSFANDGTLAIGKATSASSAASTTLQAVHTISVNGTAVATFLGSADVNFDRAAAVQEGANGVTLSSQGWQSGGRNVVAASNGKSYTVNLPSFSTSGGTTWTSDHKTTVYFSTASVSGPLASVTVDASSIAGDTQAAYNQGYSAGFSACWNGVSRNGNKIVGPTSDGSGSYTWYEITAGVGGSWTAGGGFEAHGYAYINGTQVSSATKTYS